MTTLQTFLPLTSCLKVALLQKPIINITVSYRKTTWPHRLAVRTLASHASRQTFPELTFQEIELSKQTFKCSRHFENDRKRGCLKVALFFGHFFLGNQVTYIRRNYVTVCLGGYSL
jgi:hypothetical protein